MNNSLFDAAGHYFAAAAKSYDHLQPVVAGPGYAGGMAFVVDLIPRQDEDSFVCVELGCGTASLAKSVLDRFPHASAVALDSEPAMLDIARRKLAPYGGRARVTEGEATVCALPPADLVLSAFMLHHVPPESLGALFQRVSGALNPSGCLIVLDTMRVGAPWGEAIGAQSRRLYQQHINAAIAAGCCTQDEIDARWEFKRRMKAEGKDVEYSHCAEDLAAAVQEAGFAEVGVVWRRFAFTIMAAFKP